jgi:hypothetical protein
VTNTNKINKTAITTTINPETSLVSVGTPVSLSQNDPLPILPQNKGISTVDKDSGAINIVNGTKTVTSDPQSLKVKFQDSANATVVVEVYIDIDTGFVTLNYISTNATTEVSTTKRVIFDPASNKYSSSTDSKDNINGSESGTSVNPVTGVIVKV